MLEVAPGPGFCANEIAKTGRCSVTGLDISESFVRIARENAARVGVAVDFRHGNASKMPFPDASFDCVVCTAAFKNFRDPIGALNGIHRVLTPGGHASIHDCVALEKMVAESRFRTCEIVADGVGFELGLAKQGQAQAKWSVA